MLPLNSKITVKIMAVIAPLLRAATDFLLCGNLFAVAAGYWLGRPLSISALATMSAILVAGQVLSLTYFGGRSKRLSLLLGQIALGNLLASLIYLVARSHLHGVVGTTTFAELAAILAPLQMGLHLIGRGRETNPSEFPAEPARWMVLLSLLLLLHQPLLTAGQVGAGDAYWYSVMMADFVSQLREGIFPPLVGQTEFAFNGAVAPLRVAPFLQYLGGAIDFITLGSLSFTSILNLSLLVACLGGGFSCYGCLRAIQPETPWLALLFSLLFSFCPAILALVYVGNLFMSVTTLPFIPLLLYGIWRTLVKGDRAAVLAMIAAAGALWYCHPPIALWGTIIAAISQITRLMRDGRKIQTWLDWLIGIGCFVGLTLACFVSVETLEVGTSPANRDRIVSNLQSAYPAALLPLSSTLLQLGDYQLGWSLWFALLVGAIGFCGSRLRSPRWGLGAAIVLLLVFIIPSPATKFLWFSVPQVICDLTYSWPMQRIYALLAGLVVFLAYVTIAPFAGVSWGRGFLCLVPLAAGLFWSAIEAEKIRAAAFRSNATQADTERLLLPQNRILTRYAFNPFRAIPPYFSHGFIDPLLLNRILKAPNLEEMDSNRTRVEADSNLGVIRAEGIFTTTRPDPLAPSLKLSPNLSLEPHRRYILRFNFAHPEFVGGLVFRGQRLARSYWLPHSGYDTTTITRTEAFGTLPGQQRSIVLWTDLEVPEEIGLQFFFNGPGPAEEVTAFGSYTLKEFNPTDLPVVIENWAPYRARTTVATTSYLETPRIFLNGYHAEVNGRKVPVSRSPNALVMIPLQEGENLVELSYPGPWTLRLALMISLGFWCVLVATWVVPKRRNRQESLPE